MRPDLSGHHRTLVPLSLAKGERGKRFCLGGHTPRPSLKGTLSPLESPEPEDVDKAKMFQKCVGTSETDTILHRGNGENPLQNRICDDQAMRETVICGF